MQAPPRFHTDPPSASRQLQIRKTLSPLSLMDKQPMTTADFTGDLWLFLSPWCEEKLDDPRYFDAIALAWVALWNYTADPNSIKASRVHRLCRGLFEIPTDELIDILIKRRAVFFPNDKRIIASFGVAVRNEDELAIVVEFKDE